MKTTENTFAGLDRGQAVERLTALWALNEAGLGGLIHALRVPFTGIVVGSTAVVLIALIAFFAERKAKAILKATVIVLLIKAAASPHTPLPAYVSVAFQGLAGAVLFGGLPSVRLGALLLGLLALWQGAVQKLLVMTILYGKPLWESVDAVGRWMLEKMGSGPGELSPTGWFLVAYLGYYTVAGLITGWLAGAIPGEIAQALRHPRPAPLAGPEAPGLPASPSRKRWWRRTPFKAGLVLAVLLLATDVALSGAGGLGPGNACLRPCGDRVGRLDVGGSAAGVGAVPTVPPPRASGLWRGSVAGAGAVSRAAAGGRRRLAATAARPPDSAAGKHFWWN